mmetsp:Transcript_102717/g.260945  ORF Transcript_102717/g.260945 Transcript_102717/m.260945 type:complete len:290 (-) Transcript_102717:121-990(-)
MDLTFVTPARQTGDRVLESAIVVLDLVRGGGGAVAGWNLIEDPTTRPEPFPPHGALASVPRSRGPKPENIQLLLHGVNQGLYCRLLQEIRAPVCQVVDGLNTSRTSKRSRGLRGGDDGWEHDGAAREGLPRHDEPTLILGSPPPVGGAQRGVHGRGLQELGQHLELEHRGPALLALGAGLQDAAVTREVADLAVEIPREALGVELQLLLGPADHRGEFESHGLPLQAPLVPMRLREHRHDDRGGSAGHGGQKLLPRVLELVAAAEEERQDAAQRNARRGGMPEPQQARR